METEGLLRAGAREWVERGLHVVPIRAGTKRPHIKGWADQAYSPTVADVDEWWTAWPQASVGVAQGFGTVVVDIDPPTGVYEPERWPETYTVRTPSGGWHLWYLDPTRELRSNVGLFGDGIELKARGTQVLVPPSPGYIVEHDVSPVHLPTWARAACAAERARRENRPYDLSDAPIPAGMRNVTMFEDIGHVTKASELTDAEVMEWAQERNRELCQPPLPYEEVERMVLRQCATR